MAKIILKRAAYCADPTCGAYLPPGSPARYYGRNGIFGIHCHTKSESIQGANGRYRDEEQIKARERIEQRERDNIEREIESVMDSYLGVK